MTRQWNINPTLLCDQHLHCEHKEMHQAAGSINAGRSVKGHTERGQLNPETIDARHDELAEEMLDRGMNHASPLPDYEWDGESVEIDVEDNRKDLAERCEDCAERL